MGRGEKGDSQDRMSDRTPWDWPSRADERRRAFAPEVIDARVVRHRPPNRLRLGLLLVTVAPIIVLRFFWPAIIMGFVLAGVTSPATALGVVIGLVILGTAALHSRLSGRPF